MNIQLSSVFGPPLAATFSEADCPIIIGRGEPADLSIHDRWVSRVHCLLSVSDDRLFVRDLESRHGTYVNGRQIDQVELAAGDELSIGLSTLIVQLQEADSFVHGE